MYTPATYDCRLPTNAQQTAKDVEDTGARRDSSTAAKRLAGRQTRSATSWSVHSHPGDSLEADAALTAFGQTVDDIGARGAGPGILGFNPTRALA